ncbi:MAG: polysaccharide biosynthesis protein [Clostridia bacterium]|nr:polysaccharide biosynthesis protein [Clostridia bacterium]
MKKIRSGQSLLNGALILMITTTLVHILGILYKIPLTAIIGPIGRGYFSLAYGIYTPIFGITMAGLPVAVSKLISESIARKEYKNVKKLSKVSIFLFLIIGIVGTLVLLALAVPYTKIINSPKTIYGIWAIAPSLIFCCLTAAYEGYYEGMRNMLPTAITQLVDMIGKLVVGVLLAMYVSNRGMSEFLKSQTVFGIPANTKEEAVSILAPYTACAAIVGVTVGTIIGLLYVMILYHVKSDPFSKTDLLNSPEPETTKILLKKIISIALPILLGSLILNITNIIDNVTVQNRLNYAVQIGEPIIRSQYGEMLSKVFTKDVPTFLYGAYGTAIDFKNLIPTLIMALGVSSIPALSGAYAANDRKKIENTVVTVLRAIVVISLPLGMLLAIYARPILNLFYMNTNVEKTIDLTADIVIIYSLSAILLSASAPLNSMLQSINKLYLPIKAMLAGTVVKIVLNYILVGNPKINIYGAPIGTIVCYLIILTINLYSLLKTLKIKPNFYEIFLKPLFAVSITGALTFGLSRLFALQPFFSENRMGILIECIVSGILAIFVYFVLLVLTNVIKKSEILRLPKGKKIAKVLERCKVLR